MNIQPPSEPSTPTNVQAEENNDHQAKFTNPFCTPVQEIAESFSQQYWYIIKYANLQINIRSEYRWTKNHPLTQVRGNSSKPVQTRRQLATDPKMCDKLVSWMSKKQDCTAMSSAEAEYVALSASYAQVMWMRTQLQDYGFNYNKIPLYCDSQSAIAISCNPVQHSHTKHIHTRYHFIKEQVENGIIELYFVRTEYQLADMFTKALLEERFQYLVRRIGMRCLTPAELESYDGRLDIVPNDPTRTGGITQETPIVKIAVNWYELEMELSLKRLRMKKKCMDKGVKRKKPSTQLGRNQIHKDGDGDASFQLKSDSLPHAHAQTTKTFYKHQDSRIMKAQELKTKTSAQTLIYKIFLQRYQSIIREDCLQAFQDGWKIELVANTRSQGGKDDQDGRIKI
ncbi:hypothetical protein Tco_1456660 [Tanacetum coccineum]